MVKRRTNKGCFKKGHDPRRHNLTRAERLAGGKRTYQLLTTGQGKFSDPQVYAWLFRKIRSHYRKIKSK